MAFDDLYQEIILDHARHPRNKENLDFISEDLVFENPTCGDSVKVAVDLDKKEIISRVRFNGDGCAISTASASMMTGILKGMTLSEALKTAAVFMDIMTGDSNVSLEDLGEIEALEGVRQFPQRVKCATLPWHAVKHTLQEILKSHPG